mmetsp:Transcript_8622/g.23177  ORF Transcript_8622/g.23177 Transcript_8622/m.23177 type:complete len:206 (+) Transcript_8622:2211-2828(+)
MSTIGSQFFQSKDEASGLEMGPCPLGVPPSNDDKAFSGIFLALLRLKLSPDVPASMTSESGSSATREFRSMALPLSQLPSKRRTGRLIIWRCSGGMTSKDLTLFACCRRIRRNMPNSSTAAKSSSADITTTTTTAIKLSFSNTPMRSVFSGGTGLGTGMISFLLACSRGKTTWLTPDCTWMMSGRAAMLRRKRLNSILPKNVVTD